MSVIDIVYKKIEPYFHREVGNDFGKDAHTTEKTRSIFNDLMRLTCLIPIIGLYQPAAFPLAIFLGGVRIVTSFYQLSEAVKKKKEMPEIAQAAFKTAVSVAALVLTIFLHPVGMLVTTAHDILIESYRLVKNLESGQYKESAKNALMILKNALYFALFAHGGVELAIASLVVQILVGVINSMGEFKKGNYLEAAAYLIMSMARTDQLASNARVIHRPDHKVAFQKQSKIFA